MHLYIYISDWDLYLMQGILLSLPNEILLELVIIGLQ